MLTAVKFTVGLAATEPVDTKFYDTKLYFSTAKGSSNSNTVLSTAMTIDYDGNVVFTSVDGKILICNKPSKINYNKGNLSEKSFHPLMKRNWVSKSIRIENILKRDINWCRGLCDDKNTYYTFKKDSNYYIWQHRFTNQNNGKKHQL